jgi:hypothetical protein
MTLGMYSHKLAISSQANPAQPVLSAQRGRRQNALLSRGGKP